MITFTTILLLAALAVSQDDELDEPTGDELVAVELLADRVAIRPGESFRLGVRLRIEPHWHVYWTHPGDGGLPTEASLEGPAGYRIGAARFPGPIRFEEPGDIVSYGYAEETLLIAEVKVPADATPETTATFRVEANWLVCEEICLRGRGAAEITLPIAPADTRDRCTANVDVFRRWSERLPRPVTELEGARLEWAGTSPTPTFEIEVPGATELEFYPYGALATRLEGQRRGRDEPASRLTLDYRFRNQAHAARACAGVLRVRRPDAEAYYELQVPWPDSDD